MITPDELIDMKQRIVVGVEAAHRIASTDEPFVFYDRDEYEATVGALLSLRDDVTQVLAELDILRGMFSERLSAFFQRAMKGVTPDATSGVSASHVADVPSVANPEGGSEVRTVDEAVDGGVQAERPVRKRGRRPKSKRDTGTLPADTGRVG